VREAIEVTISGGLCATIMWCGCAQRRRRSRGRAGHRHDRRLENQSSGQLESGGRQYEAKYSGSFVRRSAKLTGTQTWTDGGKTAIRACAGAIKRPFKPFLPRGRK
jgi:hypothetical protein